jgi:hypothetical protein
MATESTTLRAAARLISLGAFVAATHALDTPKMRKAARRIDKKIDKLQGVTEYKASKASKNMSHHKGYLAAGVAVLAVAGALIVRAATD